MSSSRVLMSMLVACAATLVFGCTTDLGAPPASACPWAIRSPAKVCRTRPRRDVELGRATSGREWGSTAGIDIDQTDGHVWRTSVAAPAA